MLFLTFLVDFTWVSRVQIKMVKMWENRLLIYVHLRISACICTYLRVSTHIRMYLRVSTRIYTYPHVSTRICAKNAKQNAKNAKAHEQNANSMRRRMSKMRGNPNLCKQNSIVATLFRSKIIAQCACV